MSYMRILNNILISPDILINGEKLFVPRHNKNFYKFRWNEELSLLKKSAVKNNRVWTTAGRPRSGPMSDSRQQSRMSYRKRLKEHVSNSPP